MCAVFFRYNLGINKLHSQNKNVMYMYNNYTIMYIHGLNLIPTTTYVVVFVYNWNSLQHLVEEIGPF